MEYIAPGTTSHPRHSVAQQRSQAFDELSERLDYWRTHLNQYKHPVMMFDGNLWPVLLNDVLQTLMQDQTSLEGLDQTTSGLWKQVCETAGTIVATHARTNAAGGIAEVFPIDRNCFVVLGSILRTANSRVVGAIVNLAEINSPDIPSSSTLHSQTDLHTIAERDGRNNAEVEGFQHWIASRERARKQIAVLSRRESEVLAFVADGQSNKRIAKTLGVTTKTIEKHRANAGLKLGAGSSADMVRISVIAGHRIPEAYNVASN